MSRKYDYVIGKNTASDNVVPQQESFWQSDRGFMITIAILVMLLCLALLMLPHIPNAGTIFCRDNGLGNYTYTGNDTGYCLNITAPVAFTPIQWNGSWMLANGENNGSVPVAMINNS